MVTVAAVAGIIAAYAATAWTLARPRHHWQRDYDPDEIGVTTSHDNGDW